MIFFQLYLTIEDSEKLKNFLLHLSSGSNEKQYLYFCSPQNQSTYLIMDKIIEYIGKVNIYSNENQNGKLRIINKSCKCIDKGQIGTIFLGTDAYSSVINEETKLKVTSVVFLNIYSFSFFVNGNSHSVKRCLIQSDRKLNIEDTINLLKSLFEEIEEISILNYLNYNNYNDHNIIHLRLEFMDSNCKIIKNNLFTVPIKKKVKFDGISEQMEDPKVDDLAKAMENNNFCIIS